MEKASSTGSPALSVVSSPGELKLAALRVREIVDLHVAEAAAGMSNDRHMSDGSHAQFNKAVSESEAQLKVDFPCLDVQASLDASMRSVWSSGNTSITLVVDPGEQLAS